jgi:hypothetical protein
MKPSQVVKNLRNGSNTTVENTIRFLGNNGLGDVLPDEVAAALASLVGRSDIDQDLVRDVLLSFPSKQSVPLYLKFLGSEAVPDAEHSIYGLGPWLRICSEEQRSSVRIVLEQQTRNKHPIIAALACVYGVSHLEFDESYWRVVAETIAVADGGEWWQSIRSSVEEILEPAQMKRVNLILKGMGSKPLEP